jgi:hypothetical protein
MKKSLLTIIFLVGLLPIAARAQAVAASAPAGTAAPEASASGITGTAPAGVSLAPETPVASPTALKVKAEVNPVTNKLSVRTDAVGPMRIEINDNGGRPVLTHNVLASSKAIEINVSQLPAGTYVVRCTAGEKSGMRLVRLGM